MGAETDFKRSSWVDQMNGLYGSGGGLRKLALSLQHWNAEMASNFKNLTELYLIYYHNNGTYADVLECFPKKTAEKVLLEG